MPSRDTPAGTPCETLDTTGLRCPMPVIRTESALRKLPPGTLLKVMADDPVARLDIPHFCREAGHQVEELEVKGEKTVFLITPKITGDD